MRYFASSPYSPAPRHAVNEQNDKCRYSVDRPQPRNGRRIHHQNRENDKQHRRFKRPPSIHVNNPMRSWREVLGFPWSPPLRQQPLQRAAVLGQGRYLPLARPSGDASYEYGSLRLLAGFYSREGTVAKPLQPYTAYSTGAPATPEALLNSKAVGTMTRCQAMSMLFF